MKLLQWKIQAGRQAGSHHVARNSTNLHFKWEIRRWRPSNQNLIVSSIIHKQTQDRTMSRASYYTGDWAVLIAMNWYKPKARTLPPPCTFTSNLPCSITCLATGYLGWDRRRHGEERTASHLWLTGHDGATPAAAPSRAGRTTGAHLTPENASLRRTARLMNRETFCMKGHLKKLKMWSSVAT